MTPGALCAPGVPFSIFIWFPLPWPRLCANAASFAAGLWLARLIPGIF